jgi:PAS domain S-box-containing protein
VRQSLKSEVGYVLKLRLLGIRAAETSIDVNFESACRKTVKRSRNLFRAGPVSESLIAALNRTFKGEGVMGARAPVKLDPTGDAVAKVLENAREAMVVMGPDGRIVRVNAQAEELFGYSQEELLGQKPDLLIPLRPRQRDAKRRAGHVAHQGIRRLGHDLGVLVRRRDGTSFPAEISLASWKEMPRRWF